MCDLGNMFSRMFTPPGTGGREAALQAQTDALNKQTAIAQASADSALAAQKDATAAATAASVPVVDSESAKRAGEDRMRRLLMSSTGVTAGANFLGTPPLGFRALTGQ